MDGYGCRVCAHYVGGDPNAEKECCFGPSKDVGAAVLHRCEDGEGLEDGRALARLAATVCGSIARPSFPMPSLSCLHESVSPQHVGRT